MHDTPVYKGLNQRKVRFFLFINVVAMPSIDSNYFKQFKIVVLEFIRNK